MELNEPSSESRPNGSELVPSQTAPVVFISYSWDSDDHANWVIELASDLTRSGVKVILDRWDLHFGDDKTTFMERGISKSTFVLVVCTPKYAEKANQRQGGVGYEAMIITGQLAAHIESRKFIPILRSGSWDTDTPTWLATRLGVDLRGNPYPTKQFDALVDHISGIHPEAPKLGDRIRRSSGTRVPGTVMSRRIQELQEVTLLRRNMRMTYIFSRIPGDQLLFALEVHLEWDILNFSDKQIEYVPFFAEEEHERARALYIGCDSPREAEFHANNPEMSRSDGVDRLKDNLSFVRVIPPDGLPYRYRMAYVLDTPRRDRDQTLFSFAGITEGVTMVAHAPTELLLGVYPNRATRHVNLWEFQDVFAKEQHITLYWRPASAPEKS